MKTSLNESKGFVRQERIKNSLEIKNLFKNGKKISIVGAKIFFLPNNLNFNRIAFPLPRGFGNAVARNRAKRLSREVYRNLKSHLNIGYDILFLLYPPATKDSFHSRCEQFQTLFQKAGLFKEWENFSQKLCVQLSDSIKFVFHLYFLRVVDLNRLVLNMQFKQ